MKSVQLGDKGFALIDDADLAAVSQYRWYLGRNGYAVRNPKMVRGKYDGGKQYLHRLIMGDPDGLVDHINQNKLDCRRSNLRVASKSLNALNSKVPSDNTSGVKGVDFDGARQKWSARIKVDGRQRYLGRFEEKLDAVWARAMAERWFSVKTKVSNESSYES